MVGVKTGSGSWDASPRPGGSGTPESASFVVSLQPGHTLEAFIAKARSQLTGLPGLALVLLAVAGGGLLGLWGFAFSTTRHAQDLAAGYNVARQETEKAKGSLLRGSG